MKKIILFILLLTSSLFSQVKISELAEKTTMANGDMFIVSQLSDLTSKKVTWWSLLNNFQTRNDTMSGVNLFTGANTFNVGATFNSSVYINAPGGGLYIGGLQRIDNNGNLANSSSINNSGLWAKNESLTNTWFGAGGVKHLIIDGSSATFGNTARTGADSVFAGYLQVTGETKTATLTVTSSMTSQGDITIQNGQTIYPTTANASDLGKYNLKFDSLFVNYLTGNGAAITGLTTSIVAEGTNLYYTDARWQTAWGLKTTTNLPEGSNLYYTDARARASISESVTGLDYNNITGVLSLTAGYVIPTTTELIGMMLTLNE